MAKVRDISESLGKLPPSATDLEEAVLGALLLEKRGLEVLKLLNPNHFYLETHQIIFKAVQQLVQDKNPVDMRTVVSQLRKTGHLEIIGGAHYIAELTSKVSSAANIQYHASIIIEMALKREMIQLASKIHQAAYDDTTDAIDLLDTTLQSFTALHKNEIQGPLSEQIKVTWSELMVTDEPVFVEPYIKIQHTPVASPGELSLIVGKKKSRKSLFIVWELTEFLKNHSDAAVFDTEQGRRHIWKARDRVFRISGKLIPFFAMRDKSPKERMIIIEQTLEHWPKKFKLIVIDGIRDLMSDINNPEESTTVMTWLQKISTKFNVHIINVLHLNKTDKNPRGHIGTELVNKAEATIELELDEKVGCTIVRCESSREIGFEAFAFNHGPDDLPQMVDVPIGDHLIPFSEQKNRLVAVFGDTGILKYKELVEEMKSNFDCSDRKAKTKIAEFKRAGFISSNREQGVGLLYKINITASEEPPTVLKPLHKVEPKKREEEKEFDFNNPTGNGAKMEIVKPEAPAPARSTKPPDAVPLVAPQSLDDLPF